MDFFDKLKGCSLVFLLLTVGSLVWTGVWFYQRYHDYTPAIEKALNKNDFVTAHQKLAKQYSTIQKRGSGLTGGVEHFEKEYEPIALRVFHAELNDLKKKKSVNERNVLSMMDVFHIYGVPMTGITDSKKVIKENEYYIKSVSRYNYALDELFTYVLGLKNHKLADKVLALYKSNLQKTLVKSHTFGSDEYKFEYTNEAKEKAIQKYQKSFGKPAVASAASASVAEQEAGMQVEKTTLTPDVDTNIPLSATDNSNTFVVVYANEDYKRVGTVPFAKQDGKIFAQYCTRTLGIPKKNIHVVENATLNDMFTEIDWLGEICEAFDGDAKVIVYYSGHGIPDESDKSSYLLPVDGDGKRVSSGYKLDEFYKDLGQLRAKMICVFMDACFSGMRKDGEALNPARGVALRARSGVPIGNMVVFSAAQGDETAYPYNDQQHGMLTYYLLKKLQDSKGDVTLQELGSYLTEQVRKRSLIENNKSQTPCVTPSADASEWENWKLK